ncbi:MAG: nucleotidyltransferase family protein [Thermomicrobiales bacterium]
MISGVILAAGGSSRLGHPKQLLDLGGQPLLAHILQNATASDLDEVLLVLGHEAARIANDVGEWGQRVVINPDYAKGQSTSVRRGLSSVNPTTEAVIFLLGDQPHVGPDIINALIREFRASGGRIVQSTYGGTRGNPVLIARELFPELARIRGDRGARDLLLTHRDEIVTVQVSDGPPPRDVDSEEDYQQLLADWHSARSQ